MSSARQATQIVAESGEKRRVTRVPAAAMVLLPVVCGVRSKDLTSLKATKKQAWNLIQESEGGDRKREGGVRLAA